MRIEHVSSGGPRNLNVRVNTPPKVAVIGPIDTRTMPPHLLNLPPELLEHILTLLCHEHAPSIQSCHQSCHTLHAILAHSHLVQYLEHVALQGLYTPCPCP